MRKLSCIILWILLIIDFPSHLVFGQPKNTQVTALPVTGNITGKVIEAESNVPLEFATIAVYSEIDSSLVTGGIADNKGDFKIGPLQPGRYYIEIRFMGYENYRKSGLVINRKISTIDLGILELTPVVENISEVTVIAQNKAIAYEIDRKVIDPSYFPAAANGTAVDILANAPSVTVDIEGNVTLRGSSSFTVLIDGRPTPFDPAEALQQIPASTIRNIEIITNPSAKYDPDGNAGIININTKKSRLEGFSGLINTTGDTNGSVTGDFLLNYRQGKFNYFISADRAERMGRGTSETMTMTIDSDTSYTQSTGNGKRGRNSNSFKTGFDYYINNYNTLTFNVDFNRRSSFEYSTLDFEESDTKGYFLESFTDNNSKRLGNDIAFSLDYKKTFKREGQELTGFIFYETENGKESTFYNQYDGDNILISGLKSWEVSEGEHGFRAKIDYIHPFTGKKKLEAGFQSRVDKQKEWNDIHWFTVEPDNYQPSSTSPYYTITDFSREIHALYGIFSNSAERWSYQLGLRTEYTNRVLSYSENINNYKVHRFDYFPTVHFSFQLPHDQQMITSYTRRIERPMGFMLEPFITYEDAYSVRSGNPSILPEYIDSYELGYQKQFKEGFISAEGYFRQTNDKIERVQSVFQPNVLMRSIANVGTDYSMGVELMLNLKPAKWWMLNLMGNIYRYRLKGEYDDESIRTESNNWDSRFNNTFMLSKSTKIQINAMYHSPTVTMQGRREGFMYSNLAVRQDFLNNKLSATFGVRDVLNTARFEYTSEGSNFSSYRKFDMKSPVFSVTLSYRINNYRQDRSNGVENGERIMDMEGGAEGI